MAPHQVTGMRDVWMESLHPSVYAGKGWALRLRILTRAMWHGLQSVLGDREACLVRGFIARCSGFREKRIFIHIKYIDRWGRSGSIQKARYPDETAANGEPRPN